MRTGEVQALEVIGLTIAAFGLTIALVAVEEWVVKRYGGVKRLVKKLLKRVFG